MKLWKLKILKIWNIQKLQVFTRTCDFNLLENIKDLIKYFYVYNSAYL